MKYDSIIFDVDGTLWDSTSIVEAAWNQAAVDSGLPHPGITADQLKGLFGLPMNIIIENVLPNATPKEREDFRPFCYGYEERYLQKTGGVLYPKLEETFRELSEKYPIFIVSNCQAGYIELFLDKTGFGPYVKDHLCLGDTNLLKADNIRIIVERYQLKHPLYVGDTQMDADACMEAGIPIAYAAYGFGTVKSPDLTISEPYDLVRMLIQ